jgi:transcriptional regulator
MYIPPANAEGDLATLHAFIAAHSLGIMVTTGGEAGLVATHLPLLLDAGRGPYGTLVGHVARANPQARQLIAGVGGAMVIFCGPDAYISPSWYATKAEHGKVVPTWNYVAVHAYGSVTVREDTEWLVAHVSALTARHESGRAEPWHVSDAPAEFIAQQARAIVGVEIAVARLEGKWKMSQNRSGADISGVVAGLRESPVPGDRAVAAIVAERRPEGK